MTRTEARTPAPDRQQRQVDFLQGAHAVKEIRVPREVDPPLAGEQVADRLRIGKTPPLAVVHGLGSRDRHGANLSGLADGQLGDRAEAPPLEKAPGARRHDHRHVSEPAQRREVGVIAV